MPKSKYESRRDSRGNNVKLGFSGVFAQHRSIVLRRFFKSDRPTRSGARRVGDSPFLFCQAFFFVAFVPKKKALQRRTIF
jgi:hypothetical protein